MNCFTKSLFSFSYGNTDSSYRNSGLVEHGFLSNLIFSKIKQNLGGRVKLIITGSAPIKDEVLDYLKICTGVNILEAYGLTESTGPATFTGFKNSLSGHVGWNVPGVAIKLKNHPELDYTSEDHESNFENGERVIKGEVCMKGGIIFKKYLNNPEANNEAFEDGWFRTGDVGMVYRDGRLRIFDRIKNIFKLQQGEYVTPEKIEGVIALSGWVQQCFLTGDSTKSFPVGIVLPDVLKLKVWCKNNEKNYETLAEMLNDKEICDFIFEDLKSQLKSSKLNTFEKPQRVLLTHKEMTVENDTLTPTFKVRRNFAVK